jgi:uncharacterized protein (DUF1330 family)
MAYTVAHIQVDDYEQWKEMFDAARNTVRKDAKGHRILRGAENPNDLLIQVEFPSADEARAAREELRNSGALDKVKLIDGPNILEEAEAVTY